MKLETLARQLGLTVHAGRDALDREVTSGYAADLLSCAMAKARAGSVWVTLQGHSNIVAVASLTEAAGIIITEGVQPDDATINKAQEEGVPILTTELTTFTVVGRLYELGVPGVESLDE
ncbi:MAG TPA: serine kinase [Chloroflexi bacterium]|nr:serine kinase [Chloroflexota bacterium]